MVNWQAIALMLTLLSFTIGHLLQVYLVTFWILKTLDCRPYLFLSFYIFAVISRGSSPGLGSLGGLGNFQNSATSSRPQNGHEQLYSKINKSNSSNLIKDSTMGDLEEASLTWLQKQQKKLEERKVAQRRREMGSNPHSESKLMQELKSSLDRARSETTTDGYAASVTDSLLFSETSTRESSPHKPRIIPIQIDNGQNGHHYPVKTSTPKSNSSGMTSSSANHEASAIKLSSGRGNSSQSASSLNRNASDTSYDRSRPLIQRRLRYDSESEQSVSNGGQNMASAVSNTSIDSLGSRPITPGFPTVPPTPVFGQPPG